MGVNLIQMML